MKADRNMKTPVVNNLTCLEGDGTLFPYNSYMYRIEDMRLYILR